VIPQAQRSRQITRNPRKNNWVINWVKNNQTPYDWHYKMLTVSQIRQRGDIKLDCLQAFTIENDIDILAITELNTAWDCLHFNKQ